MAPRLPMVPCKVPMVGFGGKIVGLPVWGENKDASKKEMDEGVLALGGQNCEETHNNQIVICGRSGRDVEEKAWPVWSTGGDAITSIWVAIRRTKKNEIIITVALDGQRLIVLYPTTNQKRAGVSKGGIERWLDHRGAWGGGV